MQTDWGIFTLSAAAVVVAGIAIGRISGELGERLGLGRAWAGAVLLSFATTLPEMVTTVTVTLEGAYGLALGGILGSVVFNLFILVLVDAADPESIYGGKISKNHISTGLLGTALLGLMMAGLSLGQAQGAGLTPYKPLLLLIVPVAIIALYAVGQYILFRMARQSFDKEIVLPTVFSGFSMKALFWLYALTTLVILVAASALGSVVNRLSVHYGLAATFAGATLLGIVTSLPEITNAMACARQRQYDLAVGNILGANAFVIVVLAAASLLAGNRIFLAAEFKDAVSALIMAALAVVMQVVALGALAVNSGQRLRRLSVASLMLAGLYAATLYVSYQFGR
ncbi:MAG: sodium:calcium antiporter [Elusimicrobiales bacterium]